MISSIVVGITPHSASESKKSASINKWNADFSYQVLNIILLQASN